MLALYRSGDVSGALDAFVDARKALAEHLASEPGAQLQRLHRAVLNRDAGLRQPAPRQPAVAVAAARPVPRELPPDSPAFTGREDELARLRGLLGPHDRRPGRAVVVAIHGRGGGGQCTPAAPAARAGAAHHPPGHTYIDLHGSTPRGPPRTPHEARDRCPRGLAVAA